MGIVRSYDSLDALATALSVDPVALQNTIEAFNKSARGESSDPFGRERFNGELEAPFYAIKIGTGVATTTGGLKVDEQMRVLNTEGNIIPHLYAVGEEVGGFRIHYIGGSALSHGIVTGMLVGQELSAE